MLNIKNLSVKFGEKTLLKNINLQIRSGERHLLVGHNGSGKSTLVKTIAGDSEYKIKNGNIIFNDTDITKESATQRALMGIFTGAQTVPEIPGLTILSLLKHSAIAHERFTGHDLSMSEFLKKIDYILPKLNIPRDWLNRYINVGFSGGEKKKLMLLRLVMTEPKIAILDEPDSGADIETQNLIANTIHNMKNTTFLIISHQQNFTDMIKPTHTTTIKNGEIIS